MEDGYQRPELEGSEAVTLRRRIERRRAEASRAVRAAVLAIDNLVLTAKLTTEDSLDARKAVEARKLLGYYVSWAEERSRRDDPDGEGRRGHEGAAR